jgi:hypothetical protein
LKLKISLRKLKVVTETLPLLLCSVNIVAFYAFLKGLLAGEVWVFTLET